jgi:hypothetical protein
LKKKRTLGCQLDSELHASESKNANTIYLKLDLFHKKNGYQTLRTSKAVPKTSCVVEISCITFVIQWSIVKTVEGICDRTKYLKLKEIGPFR